MKTTSDVKGFLYYLPVYVLDVPLSCRHSNSQSFAQDGRTVFPMSDLDRSSSSGSILYIVSYNEADNNQMKRFIHEFVESRFFLRPFPQCVVCPYPSLFCFVLNCSFLLVKLFYLLSNSFDVLSHQLRTMKI